MARTANPNSATSQFFVNVVDNAMLNAPKPDGYGYTVFGKVVSGMDVVNKIRNVRTGPGGPFPTDAPQPIILINSATLVN
jgi:cyclophilin family peptidyl-prolyl cis-trans isomerase